MPLRIDSFDYDRETYIQIDRTYLWYYVTSFVYKYYNIVDRVNRNARDIEMKQ